MANLRNEFEFRSALLTALGQEHTEAEAKNEEMWRRKMLDGLGVEYDQNDVNQFGLFREKLIEGVTNYSGGGGETWNTVFEGNVTTAVTEGMPYPSNTNDITLTLSGADTIKVTFNGQEYELPKVLVGGNFGYGALSEGTPDLNTYPLFIAQNSNSIIVFTQTAGTYSLKIEEPQSGGGSSDFSTAECTIVVPSPIAITAPCITPHGIDGNIHSDDITGKLTVVLYQGNSSVWSTDAEVVSVSGNAEIDDGAALITGDCTITFE